MLSTATAEKLREFGNDNLSGGIEWATPAINGITPDELARGLKQRGEPKGRAATGFGARKRPRRLAKQGLKMNTAEDIRNPTGIVLTREQKDQSLREGYWIEAIRYGLDYYIAGRFATSHRFMPVSANILHHAVELLLKACLAHDDPLDRILEYGHPRKGYGHRLNLLWQEFKKRRAVPTDFDAIIEGLDAFEEIRYPEKLIRDGATIVIDLFDNHTTVPENMRVTEKAYGLKLPQIDRLVGFLFDASGANPPFFLSRIEDDKQALKYYEMVRPTLLGRTTTQ